MRDDPELIFVPDGNVTRAIERFVISVIVSIVVAFLIMVTACGAWPEVGHLLMIAVCA